MKNTAFHDTHVQLGAKMVEFGGYHMPVQYKGIISEHKRVRETVGVFDVSHMGEFEVRGPKAFEFVQRMTTNDVTKLNEGRVQYSAMCYDDGGIVDDLLVYHCGDYVQLVVNASNLEKDFNWLSDHLFDGVDLVNHSDETALLAVQGPKARAVVQKLTTTDISDLEYYHYFRGTIAGVPCLVSRTGYTGELGYEIYFTPIANRAPRMWEAIFEAGAEYGIEPIGLGARDTLRLEVGYCLYGNDIDQTTNPLEAGLGWITKLGKGEFAGGAALNAVKAAGTTRKLVGLFVEGKSIPRHGYPILGESGPIGSVTSGTMSPILDRAVAMGYVANEYAQPGATVAVEIRGQAVPATVTKLPFVQRPQ